MWRELIGGLFDDAVFQAPAPAEAIVALERELEVAIPDDLKALLGESNGVVARYSTSLVWSVEEIAGQNDLFWTDEDFRDLYMPFDCLLFFGDAGNGDQFAYRILNGRIPDTSWIYKWDHENDNREWFATNLEDFFRRIVPKEPSR
jgi:hypothetical protein